MLTTRFPKIHRLAWIVVASSIALTGCGKEGDTLMGPDDDLPPPPEPAPCTAPTTLVACAGNGGPTTVTAAMAGTWNISYSLWACTEEALLWSAPTDLMEGESLDELLIYDWDDEDFDDLSCPPALISEGVYRQECTVEAEGCTTQWVVETRYDVTGTTFCSSAVANWVTHCSGAQVGQGSWAVKVEGSKI